LKLEIRYCVGDATAPAADGNKLIAHICNDRGAWGKGFVLSLSRRWPQPAEAFKSWFKEGSGFELGAVQFVQVKPDVWVANMIGQHGLKAQKGVLPIRYEALRTCLEKVASKAKELGAAVHMPRIGCGLAGGEWSKVEPIILEALCEKGIEVTVYDLA
jgi:O-acetyl-ADP-ribose deacetylase (regulator of RNase III)